ncbi:MAG: methyltransferase domain-containing protein [bacterium]|nr:methyltransferase domain-containing protein [bacterium]
MYEQLKKINLQPKPFEFYTAEILWNDEHISKKMLEFHLDETSEPASRNKKLIDSSVEWISSRFNLAPGTTLCDFGCGPGLYTTQFAEKGAEVTGVDISERSIGHAKKAAEQKGLEIEYVLQNYLEFTTNKQFDLITMIYCDICPLSPEQRKTLLKKFYNYLNDDGSVFLDVFSLQAFEERTEAAACGHLFMDGFWTSEDYYCFLNTWKYDKEKVVLDKYTIIEETRTREVYNWLQYYSLESITKELEENGFRVVEHYSNVAGAAFDPGSPEMALVAKKIV